MSDNAALLRLISEALHYIEFPGDFTDAEVFHLIKDLASALPSENVKN